MMYVVNDLHGAKGLIIQTLQAMESMDEGDILVINGDGAGARGPIMNKIVKIFYEVRRGETNEEVLLRAIENVTHVYPDIPKEWIYQSVHAGVFRKLMAERYPETFGCEMRREAEEVITHTLQPLSYKAWQRKIRIIYLAGNGEIVPDDFDVTDITVEKAVPPEERFYQKQLKRGFFEMFEQVEYVPYAKVVGDTLLISANLLDLPVAERHAMLEDVMFGHGDLDKVVVHYPPVVAPIGRSFDFWIPNHKDLERVSAVNEVLNFVGVKSMSSIYFGHIHLGPNDDRMNKYPDTMGFLTDGDNYYNSIWVKPGSVIRI